MVLKLKLARRMKPGPRGYPLLTRRLTLPEATDDGEVLAQVSRALLTSAELSQPVRLLGVGVTGISEAQSRQLSLFGAAAERDRRARLNRAVDALVERFGPEAVRRGGQGEVARAGLSLQIKRGDE